MRLRSFIGATALLACGLALTAAGGCSTSHPNLTVQAGITAEAAYTAAATAAELYLERPTVTQAQAQRVRDANRQVYRAVCFMRTAYDVEQGHDPQQRADGCPMDTRQGPVPSILEAVTQVTVAARNLTAAAQASASPLVTP